MQETWMKALKDSISEVFATMFFMVPEELEGLPAEIAQIDASGWLEGWVEMTRGEEKLRLLVWTPPEVARELAANILSCEPEDLSEDDVADAYREMLNMVAGSVLTAVDTESQWIMGLPQARVIEQGKVESMAAQARLLVAYEVEQKPLLAGCL